MHILFYRAIGASALALMAGPALAHATLETPQAAAGASYKAVIRIGHGCDGQPTQTLRVQLPEGFYNAKPMPKGGWTLDTVKGAYATPYDNHGTTMTEGTREVVWSGGDLRDDWYDEFVIRGTVGADVAPQSVLYFPTVQECADGMADWTDVSGGADVPNPAPGLMVMAADPAGHGGHGGHGHAAHGAGSHDHGTHDQPASAGKPVTLGDLVLDASFVRATLPGAPVAGGFVTITNGGADDVLIGASADAVAGHVEIHEMAMQGDVMRMRALPDGLPVPAGETVTLSPGGYHLMLMELGGPMVEGDVVDVTLRFEKAGEVTVPMPVAAINARNDDGKGHDHAGH